MRCPRALVSSEPRWSLWSCLGLLFGCCLDLPQDSRQLIQETKLLLLSKVLVDWGLRPGRKQCVQAHVPYCPAQWSWFDPPLKQFMESLNNHHLPFSCADSFPYWSNQQCPNWYLQCPSVPLLIWHLLHCSSELPPNRLSMFHPFPFAHLSIHISIPVFSSIRPSFLYPSLCTSTLLASPPLIFVFHSPCIYSSIPPPVHLLTQQKFTGFQVPCTILST